MKFDKVTPPAAAVFFVLAWKRPIRVVDTFVWVDAGEGKTKGRRKTESDSNVSTLRVEGEERRFALLYHRGACIAPCAKQILVLGPSRIVTRIPFLTSSLRALFDCVQS